MLWFAVTLWSALRDEPGDGRAQLYYFLLGLAETAALGAFMAQDLLLFVLFFDLMLIPFFFLIGTFGGENRIAATTKMIVYTLVGSLLMLVGAIATAVLASDSIGELTSRSRRCASTCSPAGSQDWIFCFFAAAFLVKMPAFPIHGWMPDAYRAAPLPVLVLLSAVLSKVGAYGFLRVALPLFPEATTEFQELIMLIALASILYGSVMAFTQTNVRLIAGYSSVAQLGFITLGIFSLRPDGADGAVLQMVNHGLVVAGVFMVIAILYERTRTEDLTEMGGQAMRAPVLAALFLVVTMANLAIPGSANFIGEFYILNGVFQSKIAFAFVAAIGIALAAFYACGCTSGRCTTGSPRAPSRARSRSRDGRRARAAGRVIVALALWPGLILERGEASVSESIERPLRAGTTSRAVRRACDEPGRAPGWTGYAPVAELMELRRPRHRLRRDLADHRAHRRARAGPARRACRRAASSQRIVVSIVGFGTLGAAAGLLIAQWGAHKDLVAGALRLDDLAIATSLICDRRRRLLHPALLARAGLRPAAGPERPRRVPGAAALLGARDDADRPGAEPDRVLRRPRAALDPALRALRRGAAAQGVARVRAQVPDHRLARLGDAALRARLRLRGHRLDRLLRRSAPPSAPRCSTTRCS